MPVESSRKTKMRKHGTLQSGIIVWAFADEACCPAVFVVSAVVGAIGWYGFYY